MDFNAQLQPVLQALRAERDRVDQAIRTIEGVVAGGASSAAARKAVASVGKAAAKAAGAAKPAKEKAGWTPEKRAAQAEKLRAAWAARKAAQGGGGKGKAKAAAKAAPKAAPKAAKSESKGPGRKKGAVWTEEMKRAQSEKIKAALAARRAATAQ